MKRCALFVVAIAVLLSGLCAVDSAAEMKMTFDTSALKRPLYEVGFTNSVITSSGFASNTTAEFEADYSTQKFKPYSGLYLSYYLRDNDKVAIYLELNGNLKSADGKSELKYEVRFTDSSIGSVSSAGTNNSLKIKSIGAATSVGQVSYGSLPFTIEVLDSFATLPSTTLTSTMTVKVQSE